MRKYHALIFSILFASVGSPPSQCQTTPTTHGSFSGNLELEPLADGRNMRVLQDFSYTDWQGHTLTAVKGFISDGATIPRSVWSLVGGPWDGRYRNAAVIHDVGCDSHKYTWRDTDRLFFEAMLDSGVTRSLALTMYWGVLVGGPRWEAVASIQAKTSEALEENISTDLNKLSASERKEAIVEKTTTEKSVGNTAVREYSSTVYLPSPGAAVSETQLKSLLSELKKREAAGEVVSIEEIENRSELPANSPKP
jgi:Protein of unknown function (DUF1353)